MRKPLTGTEMRKALLAAEHKAKLIQRPVSIVWNDSAWPFAARWRVEPAPSFSDVVIVGDVRPRAPTLAMQDALMRAGATVPDARRVLDSVAALMRDSQGNRIASQEERADFILAWLDQVDSYDDYLAKTAGR